MAVKTYTPLLSEVLRKVNNAKTKDKKIAILKENDTQPLRMVIKGSFDPKIEWLLPEGDVPYKPNESAEGTEHTVLAKEAKKLYHYVKGGNNKLPQTKRETMFIQLLEGLHKSEAELVINAKDKKLHQVYKGLSAAVVKEAFNWNDNFSRR
tara:strand:- start:78 stop:530 length:453 start_codon:yes stop_codon:yes gene_type:complete